MDAEPAAGIPLLSHLGCHQIIQPSNTPGHQTHLADEAYHSPSFRKNHDGSIAPISNSIESSAILCDSALGKTAKSKGNIVFQSDFCSAPLPPDSVTNIPIGHSGKILTSGLLPTSRLLARVTDLFSQPGCSVRPAKWNVGIGQLRQESCKAPNACGNMRGL
jgi:hypothetical protein